MPSSLSYFLLLKIRIARLGQRRPSGAARARHFHSDFLHNMNIKIRKYKSFFVNHFALIHARLTSNLAVRPIRKSRSTPIQIRPCARPLSSRLHCDDEEHRVVLLCTARHWWHHRSRSHRELRAVCLRRGAGATVLRGGVSRGPAWQVGHVVHTPLRYSSHLPSS